MRFSDGENSGGRRGNNENWGLERCEEEGCREYDDGWGDEKYL